MTLATRRPVRPLHGSGEAVFHRLLKCAARLVDERLALQFDHRLLDIGVHVAEQARKHVAADHHRARGRRCAAVIALMQRHHRIVHGLQDMILDDRTVCGVRPGARLSTRLRRQDREREKTDRKNPYAALVSQ